MVQFKKQTTLSEPMRANCKWQGLRFKQNNLWFDGIPISEMDKSTQVEVEGKALLGAFQQPGVYKQGPATLLTSCDTDQEYILNQKAEIWSQHILPTTVQVFVLWFPHPISLLYRNNWCEQQRGFPSSQALYLNKILVFFNQH